MSKCLFTSFVSCIVGLRVSNELSVHSFVSASVHTCSSSPLRLLFVSSSQNITHKQSSDLFFFPNHRRHFSCVTFLLSVVTKCGAFLVSAPLFERSVCVGA